jgi:hypothetical protein
VHLRWPDLKPVRSLLTHGHTWRTSMELDMTLGLLIASGALAAVLQQTLP